MLSDQIYVKTSLAKRALQSRGDTLSARERRVLILLDGDKTVAALADMLPGIHDLDDMIQRLAESGYIEPLDIQPQLDLPADGESEPDLDLAAEEILRLLREDFGSRAGELPGQVAQCRSAEQLLDVADRIHARLLEFAGRGRAEHVCARIRALLQT